jgi:Beta-propeller repeat
VLSYATYLGGSSGDSASAVAVDSAGNTYVTGTTLSPDFPTLNALRPDFGSLTGCSLYHGPWGGIEPVPCTKAFIAKLNSDGSAFMYVTFLGGTGNDTGAGVAVDSAGNAYVTGTTYSSDFPLFHPLMTRGYSFLLKLNPAGSALIYSTRIGGTGSDTAKAIAVDTAGNAYVTGSASSTDFPSVNPLPGGACTTSPFVMKLNAAGSSLIYSTCLGSGGPSVGNAIAVDNAGSAYITGQTVSRDLVTLNAAQPSPGGNFDAFVSRLAASGSLIYSTYLGGADQDLGFGIAVDGVGNAYVTGSTNSDNFPTRNPLQRNRASPGAGDAFITKFDPAGVIVYSTYLGGSSADAGFGIVVDNLGNASIAGDTLSTDFPMVNAIQPTLGGRTDAFVAKLNASGSALLFSTYLGGTADDQTRGIAADARGNLSIVGTTTSQDFPTAGSLQSVYKGGTNPRNGVVCVFSQGCNAFVANIAEPASVVKYAMAQRGGSTFTASLPTPLVTVGYGRIQPDSGSVPPDGVAIFGLRQNGALIAEQGVPAVAPVNGGRIYAEVGGPVTTGLALANGNDAPASISFFFTDQNGIDFGQGSFTIPANGQFAGFLNEAPFLSGTTAIQGTFTFAASVPVSAIALRGFTNERSEFLTTTLPVVDLSAPAADPLLIPHFADGGGWSTEVLLVNTSDAGQNGTIQFFAQGNASTAPQPLTITVDGQQGDMFSYSIAPRSSRRLQTSNGGSTTQVGSVIVTPTSGSFTPTGLLIFSFHEAGVTVTEAGVPTQRPSRAFRMYAEASADIHKGSAGMIQTGFAVANASAVRSVIVNLELTTLSGAPTGFAGTISLPPRGQAAMFLSEIPGFASLPIPFRGVLRISTDSDSGISAIGIRARYNERRDFLVTTTPPVDETISVSNSEMTFPHLAVGGSYTTEMVLFSGHGQSAAGRVSMYSQAGQPLSVALH